MFVKDKGTTIGLYEVNATISTRCGGPLSV